MRENKKKEGPFCISFLNDGKVAHRFVKHDPFEKPSEYIVCLKDQTVISNLSEIPVKWPTLFEASCPKEIGRVDYFKDDLKY